MLCSALRFPAEAFAFPAGARVVGVNAGIDR